MSAAIEKARKRRAVYIPKGAQRIRCKTTGAECFAYSFPNGKLAALAFKPRAEKPTWHFSFRNPESRAARISGFLASIRDHDARKAQRRADDAKPHRLDVGVILVSSWGYEQTNVDFYVVTKRIGATMVEIAPIGAATCNATPGYSHGMAEHVTAGDPEKPNMAKATRHKVRQHGADASVRLTSYSAAYVWDGKPRYCSWYA